VTPHPPVQRALRETVAKLLAAGHEVIDWDPTTDATDHKKGLSLLERMFTADGGESILRQFNLSDEVRPPHTFSLTLTTIDPLSMSHKSRFR
jgi:hypothetical protein